MVVGVKYSAVKERIVTIVWNAFIGQSRMLGFWWLVSFAVRTIIIKIKMF
jgi:hypothetical protein